MRGHLSNEHSLTKITSNNPEVNLTAKYKQANITANKSPIITRKPKGALEDSICFISPKKIGYFQAMDESCLNESQRTMFKRQSQKTEGRMSYNCPQERENEIDYRSIKKCLSPRFSRAQNHSGQLCMNHSAKVIQRHSKDPQTEDTQSKQRLIFDLKMQVLEMGQLLQEKQKIIEYKNAKIADLERELGRDLACQTTSASIKSISTFMDERSPSFLEPFSPLNSYQNGDKSFEIQQRLQSYESKMKKLQIQIDILKKYRFDKQKIEAQMTISSKKNESLRRKVNRLTDKNSRLVQEINRYKHENTLKEDRSIILQYSPEKHSIQ